MEIGYYVFAKLNPDNFRSGTKEGLWILSGVDQLNRPSLMILSKLDLSDHQTLLRKVCAVVKRGKQPFLMPAP